MATETQGNAANPAMLATEICGQMKKTLDAYRLYERGHTTIDQFHRTLFEKLSAFLAGNEELRLQVTALSFAMDGKTVFAVERREDSVSLPLFLDGIQQMTFTAGLELREVEQFLGVWRRAIDGGLPASQTISTILWESELPHLHFVATDTFAEAGAGKEDDGKKEREEHLRGLISAIGGKATSYERAARTTSSTVRMLRVSLDDLAILNSGAAGRVTDADLERQDVSKRGPSLGLDEQETQALVAGLREPMEKRLGEVFAVLTKLADGARPKDVEILGDIASRVIDLLLRQDRLGLLSSMLRGAYEFAGSDTGRAGDRFRIFQVWQQRLEAPEALRQLVTLLDAHEDVMHTLRFLRPAITQTLIEHPHIRLPSRLVPNRAEYQIKREIADVANYRAKNT